MEKDVLLSIPHNKIADMCKAKRKYNNSNIEKIRQKHANIFLKTKNRLLGTPEAELDFMGEVEKMDKQAEDFYREANIMDYYQQLKKREEKLYGR